MLKSNVCARKRLKTIEIDGLRTVVSAKPPVLEDPKLLTSQEAAALLRLSEATVRRLIRQRKLPGTRIGRDYRIPRAQLIKSLYSPQ